MTVAFMSQLRILINVKLIRLRGTLFKPTKLVSTETGKRQRLRATYTPEPTTKEYSQRWCHGGTSRLFGLLDL